jgi:hypothetical protein
MQSSETKALLCQSDIEPNSIDRSVKMCWCDRSFDAGNLLSIDRLLLSQFGSRLGMDSDRTFKLRAIAAEF